MSAKSKCSVRGCNFCASKFYSIPKYTDPRSAKWIAACGNPQLAKVPNNLVHRRLVCAAHFEERFMLSSRLSRTAMPTLHLPDSLIATTLVNAASKEQESLRTPESCEHANDLPTAGSPDSPLATNQTEKESVNEPDAEDEGFINRWTMPCIWLLLETYLLYEKKFNNGKHSQQKIWEEVSQILILKGHIVTGPQCAAKLCSLKKTYESVKSHNSNSENKKTWQFYETMDKIVCEKAWGEPVAIASSTGLSNRQDKRSHTRSSRGCGTSRSKIPVISILTKRLKQREEHEKARAKRHKERMEMDREILAVLKKLANK